MSFAPLSLKRNFSWTFVGNVIYAATQWGVLVVLARFGTPETVGQFALGLAITAPIIMFSNLQLRGVQATDAKRTHPFSHYLILRTSTTTLALLVIVGIVYMGGYQGTTALVILLVGLAKALESMSDVFYGLLQQRERMDRIAQSVMLRGALSLVAVAVLLYATGSLVAAVVGMATVWAAVLVTFDVPNGIHLLKQDADTAARKTAPSSALFTKQIAKLALTALPLGFVMLLISLNANIPKYVIDSYLGTADLGMFAALTYFAFAGTAVVSALGQSATPQLSKLYANIRQSEFLSLLRTLVLLGLVLGLIGVLTALLLGEAILHLVYGPEYAHHARLLVLVMLYATVAYVSSLLGYGITAARYFNIQLPSALFISGITLALCIVLVPAHGLYGAVISLLGAQIIKVMVSVFIATHALGNLSKQAGVSGPGSKVRL